MDKGRPEGQDLMFEVSILIQHILKVLGWSERKFYYNRNELVELGIVFYRREGRPPRRKIYAFPSRIQRYVTAKALKGELL